MPRVEAGSVLRGGSKFDENGLFGRFGKRRGSQGSGVEMVRCDFQDTSYSTQIRYSVESRGCRGFGSWSDFGTKPSGSARILTQPGGSVSVDLADLESGDGCGVF